MDQKRVASLNDFVWFKYMILRCNRWLLVIFAHISPPVEDRVSTPVRTLRCFIPSPSTETEDYTGLKSLRMAVNGRQSMCLTVVQIETVSLKRCPHRGEKAFKC